MRNVKLIAGLANPIKKYNHTRHNIGAWFVDKLANKYNIVLKKNNKYPSFYMGKLNIINKCIILFISNEFMNFSGKTIFFISSYYNISVQQMLIVHDELDLLPGCIKLKYGLGHNGHNGVRNILNILGNNSSFLRIQIGIGRPKNNLEIARFVLSEPSHTEQMLTKRAINRSISKISVMLKQNFSCRQSLFLAKTNTF